MMIDEWEEHGQVSLDEASELISRILNISDDMILTSFTLTARVIKLDGTMYEREVNHELG